MTNTDRATIDVFAAAERFNQLWNSSAHATDADTIHWQCDTWGSGTGRGFLEETALFDLVAERFGLDTWANDEARDELVAYVPLKLARSVFDTIQRIGQFIEDWTWLQDESHTRAQRIIIAAEQLGLPGGAIETNVFLLRSLRID